jgi:phosphoribosylglycinamide formyltransferase 1
MPLSSFSRRRSAVFFSGSGSTLQALIDQAESLNIVCAVSSKKNAKGLIRTKRAGLVSYVFKFPENFNSVLTILNQKQIDTIFLAGFMRILPSEFIKQFNMGSIRRRIFNIHPSLLPDFKGLLASESAFDQGAALGVTIHNVVEEVDSGAWFKRMPSLSREETRQIKLPEALLWQRATEQNILKTWGSCHQ